MRTPPAPRWSQSWSVFGAVTLTAALGGCGGGHQGHMTEEDAAAFFDCTTEPRAVPAVPGLAAQSQAQALTVSLSSLTPTSLIKGYNTWRVHVAGADGQAVPSATVNVTPFMPLHRHGTKPVEVSEIGGGDYELGRLYLYMAGFWEVRLDVTASDGTHDALVFPVCISG